MIRSGDCRCTDCERERAKETEGLNNMRPCGGCGKMIEGDNPARDVFSSVAHVCPVESPDYRALARRLAQGLDLIDEHLTRMEQRTTAMGDRDIEDLIAARTITQQAKADPAVQALLKEGD